MNVIIIYSGDLGSTEKAARYLADELGGAELADTALSPVIDYKAYDAVVFGTNVRMFRLNKRFRKYAASRLRSRADGKVYAFVMCADDRKSDKFVRKADKALRSPGATVYAGGELNTDKASSFEKSIIEGVEAAFKKEGRALPQIMYATLRDLAERIKADLDKSKNDESEKAE